jgi:hypothetical protein
VQFVCVHTGGGRERGIRIIRDAKNVSAEIAGSNPKSGFVEMALVLAFPANFQLAADPLTGKILMRHWCST